MFGSTTSFNIIKNPFSHNVINKLDKDGWKQLDLKKKIAQLIMVRVNGKFYNSENYYKRNLKKWISEDEIGGVISFSGNIHGTYYNIKDFQSWANTPLLVASDLERGLGQMMNGGTLFPSNMAIAATGDTTLAYKQGQITMKEYYDRYYKLMDPYKIKDTINEGYTEILKTNGKQYIHNLNK